MSSSGTSDDGSLGDKAARSVGWVVVDKWGNRISTLIVLIFLGRLLNPSAFGLLALASAYVAFAQVFVDQGFSKALVQRKEISSGHSSTAFWTSVVTALLLAGISILTAPGIAFLFGEPELAPVIQWMSIGLVLNACASTPAALLERDFKFRSLAVRRVSGTISGGLVAVIAALLGFGVWSLVAQVIVGALVGVIALWTASRWRPTLEFSWKKLNDLRAIGVSVIGIELIGLLNSQADRLVIGAFFSAEALGYYFLAMRIVSILVELFSSVVSGVSLTSFSRLQNDRPRMLSWLYRLSGLSSAIAVPAFAMAALTAPVLIPLVFGAQWSPAVPLFQILSFLGALNSVAYFDRSVLLAVGAARAAFLLTAGQTALGIALVFAATPFGVMGVAAAVTLRQYLYWPLRLYILKRSAGVSPLKYLGQWLRPFAISVVVVGVCLAAVALWPSFFANQVAYLVVIGVFGVAAFAGGTWLLMPSMLEDVVRVARRQFGK